MTEKLSCERLSPMQQTCMRMMLAHKTAPEIAHELEISKSTVDSHLAAIRRTLGVARTSEAVRIFRAFQEMKGSSDPTTYIAPVDRPAPEPSPDVQPSNPPSPERTLPSWWWEQLPVRQPGARSNDLTILQRLFWIPALAVAFAIGFGMLAVGIHFVSDLVR